jgi:hypothetical protein
MFFYLKKYFRLLSNFLLTIKLDGCNIKMKKEKERDRHVGSVLHWLCRHKENRFDAILQIGKCFASGSCVRQQTREDYEASTEDDRFSSVTAYRQKAECPDHPTDSRPGT